jgi:hypothetical protein
MKFELDDIHFGSIILLLKELEDNCSNPETIKKRVQVIRWLETYMYIF